MNLSQYFFNIPKSMFTAFRCFTGECVPWHEKSGTSTIDHSHPFQQVLVLFVLVVLDTSGVL